MYCDVFAIVYFAVASLTEMVNMKKKTVDDYYSNENHSLRYEQLRFFFLLFFMNSRTS